MNVVYKRIGGYSKKDSINIIIKGIKIIAPVNIKDPKDEDKMIPAKPMKMARRDKEFLLDIL